MIRIDGYMNLKIQIYICMIQLDVLVMNGRSLA